MGWSKLQFHLQIFWILNKSSGHVDSTGRHKDDPASFKERLKNTQWREVHICAGRTRHNLKDSSHVVIHTKLVKKEVFFHFVVNIFFKKIGKLGKSSKKITDILGSG